MAESIIHGYHKKKVVWNNPVVREDLCECEVRNPHNTHAIAVKIINGNLTVVGHIPQRMFSICFIFSVVKIIGGKNIGG